MGGYVLIPCIEKNAFGALKAYNADLLASGEIPSQRWEDLDRVGRGYVRNRDGPADSFQPRTGS